VGYFDERPVLERIALHQTRLRTPGLGLDSKGVALGAKGLLLLPSIDRLVALLSAYTRERSLEDLMPGLAIHLVRSKLGTREIVFEFAAESSDRMDFLADAARLVGGFAFTGTSRHFVQYRDAAAPFGYDATDLLGTDAGLALYHDRFSQTYDIERDVPLRALLMRLMPRGDPATRLQTGPRWVVAEQGLGLALVHYLARSHVEGEVCVVEWPPQSAFDDAPIRRWVLRVPEPPARMRSLLHETPGITCFVPTAPGIAVQMGFRHPIELRACPLFDPIGLVLLRGRGEEPWVIERLPAMGALTTFARVELRPVEPDPVAGSGAPEPESVRVVLRVVPSGKPWRNVTASWIAPEQLPLLRRLAYFLPHATIARVLVAITARGAFLRASAGIESIPIGTFFAEVHPGLYVPAGFDVTPAVAPEVLARAIAARGSDVVFVGTDARAIAIDTGAFGPLEAALLAAPPWEALIADAIAEVLEEPVDLKVTPIGMMPLRRVQPPFLPARGAGAPRKGQ
jgi:hypothetical protein